MNDDARGDEGPAVGGEQGHEVDHPGEVSARGWKNVAVRVKDQVKEDQAPLLAAGVAFYALLALVPSMVALVSIYGLVADPEDVQNTTEDALEAAPTEVQDLVSSQLDAVVNSQPSGLRAGVAVGLLLALWSASSGMKNLMGALTLAYEETEDRKFFRLRGTALALTFAAVVVFAVALAGMVAPSLLDDSGAQGTARSVLGIARWFALALIAMGALAALYRFGPDREPQRWRWTMPGAVLATVVAVAASIGFSLYTANFGSYNETYGALGAIVVLMLWLFLICFAVILGAELNDALERQTGNEPAGGPAHTLDLRGDEATSDVEAEAADTRGAGARIAR